MVLRTLNADKDLSPLSAEEGQSLADYRDEIGFRDKPDFLANPVFEGRRERMTGVADQLGESSEYFLLDATAEVADRNLRLYSVLHRHNRQIETLVRASGSL